MAHIDINPIQKVWLDYENYSTIQQPANSGRFGQYNRQGTNGYVDETFLKFDMTPISGTVTSASIDLTCTFKGVQYWQTTIYLYEQDKTNPNTITFPYKFSDFTNTAWGTQANSLLSSFIGGNQVGILSFPSNQTFINLVQKWVNDSSLNWGFVVSANLGFFDAYLTVDAAVLRVDYQNNWIHTHKRSKNIMDLRANTQQTILTDVFASSANTAIIQDALTLTASDIRISKNGGTISTPSISGSITHAYSGKYYVTLTSAAFNTPGTLDVMINKSGSMPVTMSYNIMPETKYDAIYSSGTFDVNVTKVGGSTQTIATQGSVDSITAKLPAIGNIAGQDLLEDVDAEVDAIHSHMPVTGQVADQASMEMILAVLPMDQIVGISNLGAMTLADSVDNYHVLINAIKTHDSTDATSVSGSVYQDILTPLSNIDSQLPAGGADIASGVQVEEVAQNTRYIMKNRMVKNNDGTITFYQDDDTTPAFSVSHTETERMPL